MHTERFIHLRKEILKKIFDKRTISSVWRKIVKNQLRRLDIQDIYDFYDFNYNIEDRAQTIRNEILNGNYKVSKPIVSRIEKKYGICRHLIMPQPMDALVIQVLTEAIVRGILKKQPSNNSFYSRDRHNIQQPHEIDDYGLSQSELWKKLQKQIYHFNEEKELIVVTDLSNYYDSIDIRELRSVVASLAETHEVLIDLLFCIIEDISWRPDYLPYKSRGLPTANLEAIRLLAHSFLFELDEVIKKKTNNCFTRWMDDITIGIDTRKEAVETISAVSDILKTRGLALNLSKTDIYNYEQAKTNFQIDVNKNLDIIQEVEAGQYLFGGIKRQQLIEEFERHINVEGVKPRYWDKVLKRFITTFAKYKSHHLLQYLEDLYINSPSVRPQLLYYLEEIGYSETAANTIIRVLREIAIYDDVSLFQICNLVTKWEVKLDEDSSKFLKFFEEEILTFSTSRQSFFDFYCTIWFKTKYSNPEDLFDYIKKFQNLWQADNFLRRQVTCSLARIYTSSRKDEVNNILQTQISSGIISVVSAATQIQKFTSIKEIDKRLSSYLFYKRTNSLYPLSKFLVLCSILNSYDIRKDNNIKTRIKQHVTDPYYLKWLESQYYIS